MIPDLEEKMTQDNEISRTRLAIAHNQLGVALMLINKYDSALDHFNISIQTYRGMFDYWDRIDTDPKVNMGFAKWRLGNLEEASSVLESCLRAQEARCGIMDGESFRTGRVLHALGNVRFDQERIQESEEFHEKAI